ncbi:fibroin-3 related [Trichoderma arundinaceum]|uniref:Fibroin-3 related n=1 Tax=Trichoderma arundinaceum TaxID=490622 RepID=A0A395NJ32_TRIAR|nr:fibroin-3 related [Trichoderma arundinaceum]
MPSVDVAMVRSLRGGLWETIKDSIGRSIAAEVVRRDIVKSTDDKISEIKQAFSSWDSCMAHVYCKWPVIALIIVGGLILLSILICIVRCTCLGMSCCCSCCYCLKCCGNCCGCCDAPGGRPAKHLDEPYNPQQSGYSGYRQEAPMAANVPTAAPAFNVAPASHGPPQYAEFDVSKHDADALPAMPSWESANSKQIVLEEEVEMDNLPPKKEPAPPQNMNSPRYGGQQQQQQQQRRQPPPRGPMGGNDPYGQQRNNMNSYGQQPASPYGGQDQGFAAHDQGFAAHDQGFAAHDQGYNRHDQGYNGHDQAYGVHDRNFGGHDQPYGGQDQHYGAQDQHYGAQGQGYNGHEQGFNGHEQSYGVHDQHYNGHEQGYDNHVVDGYAANQPYDHAVPAAAMRMSPGHQSPTSNQHEFGIPRQMTPGPAHMPTAPHELDGHTSPDPYGADPHMRKSPGPGLNQRQSPGPQSDFGIAPQNKPVPFRTYTPGPQNALQDAHAAPITNNAGFDFNSGYARPQTRDGPNYDRRPSESHEREDNEGYPGYKPYSPAPQNWTGI